jgi:hypothetical protein
MAQEQLREAHELIEQGRLAEARQLLETLDDPTARLWLTQITAARRVRRQSLSRAVPLPLLIAIAVFIGIGALIVILLLTPTLIQRIQERNQQQSPITLDVQLQAQLIDFCTAALGAANSDKCHLWTQTIMGSYHAAAATCLSSFGGTTPDLRVKFATCLTNAGVPLPT